jgi:hypothetical protein
VIRSRKIRWAKHVALVEKMRNAHKIIVGNLKGRSYSEDLGVDGMNLRGIGWEVVYWMHLTQYRN